MSEYEFSVVIPTKDRHDKMDQIVPRLLKQKPLPRKIVVVDASEVPWHAGPALREEIAEAGVMLTVLRADPSTSAQRNVGIREVETPIVLLLDDDVVLSDNYMEALLARWQAWGLSRLGGVVGSRRGHPVPVGRLLRRVLQVHTHDPRGTATRLRASGKLQWVDSPSTDVFIPAVGAGAVTYRTDLLRKHRFDEHFPGYALGEDLDLAQRLARDAPILQTPEAWFLDVPGPGGGTSRDRWYFRGRRETYFRMKHLRRGVVPTASFIVSIVGETVGAAADSVAERDPRHVRNFLAGFARTLREKGAERLKPGPYYQIAAVYRRAGARRASRHSPATPWVGTRILGYHRISDENDPLAVPPARFRAQLESMLSAGMVPAEVGSALDQPTGAQAPQRFCVTFDDGYFDVLENAVPILEDLGIPATMYLTTWVVDRSTTFAWYRVQPAVMDWSDVRDLAGRELFDVGAHTRTHALLPYLARRQAAREIGGSRDDLEEQIGRRVTSFCYPAGLYGERDVTLVREAGFTTAVTTDPGVVGAGTPSLAMPRTMINGLDDHALFNVKIAGVFDERTAIDAWRHRRRGGAASGDLNMSLARFDRTRRPHAAGADSRST